MQVLDYYFHTGGKYLWGSAITSRTQKCWKLVILHKIQKATNGCSFRPVGQAEFEIH